MADPTSIPSAMSTVPARAGLLGNPSDGYGGRVLACTISQLTATVTARRRGGADDVHDSATDPAAALLDAALEVVDTWMRHRHGIAPQPLELSCTTTIPRQCGLAGSSAIVIAAIEAVAAIHGCEIDPVETARLALEAETDLLAITAGPQDRIVQAHRGLLDMNFARPWDPTGYRRLPATALPPLVVAWQCNAGESSATVHGDLRARWAAGDREVRSVMSELADLARRGAEALVAGRPEELAALVDAAGTLRRQLWILGDGDEALLAVAADCGAAATLAGSGGAIVAVPRARSCSTAELVEAFEAVGHDALVPGVVDVAGVDER